MRDRSDCARPGDFSVGSWNGEIIMPR